jgi:hypothetical protein
MRYPSKYIKSKYKHVGCKTDGSKEYWQAYIPGEFRKCYNTERQAAIEIDKHLISVGKEPVNILKRKTK